MDTDYAFQYTFISLLETLHHYGVWQTLLYISLRPKDAEKFMICFFFRYILGIYLMVKAMDCV